MCDRIQEEGTESTNILKDKTFYFEKANGQIELKRSQIFLSNSRTSVAIKESQFCVYTGKNAPLYVETVTFDENLQQHILTQIEFFFRWAVLPELLTRRVQRGEKLYQQGEWKENFFKKKKEKNLANFIAIFHEKILL